MIRPRPIPLLSLSVALFAGLSAFAQTAQIPSQTFVDETKLVTLHGTVHALAQAQFDRGAVPDSFAANRMLLLLKRPADREAALHRFLRDVHVPGSPSYHNWVTPEEFGSRFGAADEDITAVLGWLQSHGFSVPRVAKNRTLLEFSGTAAQVREALHAEIHQYVTDGETHYSVANEVSIPEALAPLIRGFAPLNNFELTSYVHTVGGATYSRATRRATPLFTTTLGAQPFYALAPEDFGVQYDLPPLYNAGTDGTGQTIGIIGGSNIDLGLVDAYRKLFGLPADNTQVVIDGEDPGPQLGPNVEGFLDVEVSGAVAPKATINFYIAGGTHFQSLVTLAAVRAVEDNQASVVSASFGECEQLLGQAGNQFWGSLWEQAAAQGQTVLVSSGDSGPTTCPLAVILPGGTEVTFGLSVNGLSSTPWNVSVGGTDFFYSDYASGAPSAATLWNQTNDSSLGSLKAPLPEQPWDDQFGFNAIPTSATRFSIPSAAGGGGPSSCANSTASPPAPPVCVSGYAKPSWQNAPGVPNDGVRDLPDVSLFAANGKNFSAYPICANPGDCAPVATGEPQILLVGGTSASAPAMAGIMALVNQKTGSRQGQADFILYALARQQPSVFHDITMGGNDTLCVLGFKDCNLAIPNAPTIGHYGVYPAGTGYDFPTGLGSIDANALITNWNSITLLPTATTLQLSPSTVMHGSPVTVTAVVQARSGSAVPTGDLDLATTSSAAMLQSGVLSLSNGSASSSVSLFPGGTYQVTAEYAGDGVFAGSSSSPVTLTVTPESSSTSLNLQFFYIDYAAAIAHSGTVQNGGQVPYSSEWTFEAQPSGQNSRSLGLATGTATFTDGGTSAQVPLNSRGVAAWSPQSLSVGSHSVTVNYSGDASYTASSAGPLTFTVTKGIPRLLAGPMESTVGLTGGTAGTYLAGSNLDVAISIGSVASAAPPSGMVTVSLGNLTQTVTLAPFTQAFRSNSSTAVATFSNVPAGTYTLSASYGGDNNWNSATFTYPLVLTFAAATVTSTTTTLTASSSSISTNGSVTLTAMVQPAQGSTVVGGVEITADGADVAFAFLAPTGFSPPTNTVTLTLPGARLPVGNVQLRAIFQGSPGLAPSLSAPVSVTVTPADFGMSIGESRVTVKSGQSASVPLLLVGPNGGGVSVSLACLPSSSSIGCVINTPSLMVKQNVTEQLTINAFVPGTATAGLYHVRDFHAGFLAASACFASVFGALLALPGQRRRKSLLLGFALSALIAFVAGCGGGSAPPPPPPPPVNAPPGTYSVVVTGTSGGVIHNAKITVIVQ